MTRILAILALAAGAAACTPPGSGGPAFSATEAPGAGGPDPSQLTSREARQEGYRGIRYGRR